MKIKSKNSNNKNNSDKKLIAKRRKWIKIEKEKIDDVCSCPECGQEYNDECESCYKLYHLNCTTLQTNDNLKEIDFICNLWI